jgi:CheY-like chemotaxis protein
MHHGTVRAQSAGEAQGSTLTVSLPTILPPVNAAPSRDATAASGRGRVLLVDDNQDAADTAAALLELAGYEVRIAYDPGVALALLEEFAPQVAVLDIGLPGMSGYELAARLRGHPNGSRCQLIALTGYGTAADAAQALEAGFRQHLVKPATPDTLLDAVADALHEEQGNA